MKKTHDANIGGTIFHVEEDAYGQLEEYLKSIKGYFASYPDSDDILADIEGRIAEQLLQWNASTRIVTLANVDRIISAMGRVEQFGESEVAEHQPIEATKSDAGYRKLFRDPDQRIIAGVAAGVAAYLGLSTALVRALLLATLLLGGTGVFVYLLLWIIVPEAKTTTDKLQMRGNPVTLAAVEQGVRNRVASIAPATKGVAEKLIMAVGLLIRVVFIGIAWMIGIGAVLGVLACTVILVTMLVNPSSTISDPDFTAFFAHSGYWYYPFVISGYVAVVVPLVLIVMIALAALWKRDHIKMRLGILLLGLWVASLLFCAGIWASYSNYHPICKDITVQMSPLPKAGLHFSLSY